MDRVYEDFESNSTSKINIKEYFEAFGKLLTPVEYPNLNEIFFNKKQLNLLSQKCSIDHLSFEGEPEASKSDKDAAEKAGKIPEDTQLETLRKLREKYSKDQGKTGEYVKYRSEILINYKKSSKIDKAAVPGKDIAIFIRVYHPFKSTSSKNHINLSSVIMMLGDQTLDKLRDKINCISDLTIAEDVSENPHGRRASIANRDIYKSGFFYIEGTFYNDMRDRENMDNSAVIRTWGEGKGLGPFKISKMEETRLDSLTLRFGYPWVYQHQGSCEHLIVFSDARLVNPDDDLDISQYPKIQRVKPSKNRLCMLCHVRQVHWLVMESDRMPHNPCYSCDQCFISYNYIDGKKLGSFKAYRYPYDPVIMKSCIEEPSEMEIDQGE